MNELLQKLNQCLFTTPGTNVYAVLDGASIPGLLDTISAHKPEHVCLYRGELEPELAECAPYLVCLQQGSEFTDWLLQNGWGKHWGIFALSPAEMKTMRKHFRTFLMVKSPEGRQLYFRYYDPRVLRLYLPTCNAEDIRNVFGPIKSYLCEDDQPGKILLFQSEGSQLIPSIC